MGSSVYAGLFDLDEMLAVTDLDGTSVSEALTAIGYAGTDTPPEAISYAEIHIEQGRILEREATDIGVVEASWYTQKLDIDVLGEQSHTGATAMADRHDALVAAAKVVLAVAEVVDEFEEGLRVVGRPTRRRTELADRPYRAVSTWSPTSAPPTRPSCRQPGTH